MITTRKIINPLITILTDDEVEVYYTYTARDTSDPHSDEDLTINDIYSITTGETFRELTWREEDLLKSKVYEHLKT